MRSACLDICDEVIANYYWDYLKEDNFKSKCQLKDVNIYGQQPIDVPVGIPDHAILRVQIKLKL